MRCGGHAAVGMMLVVALCLLACGSRDEDKASLGTSEPPTVHIDEILSRGKLRAITSYSAVSYFIYKGEPMGFEYELLSNLARHLGVKLEIVVARDIDQLFDLLLCGEGDLIAFELTVTGERASRVAFTDAISLTRQVLVQRMPDDWRAWKRHEIDQVLVRNPLDLLGKTVIVKKDSAFVPRLKNLSEELGGEILIHEVGGDVYVEDLIQQVARGEIEFTVADECIARIQKRYYANIDVETPLSLPQRIAWAVRKDSLHLRGAINQWLAEMKRGPKFNVIYEKYYRNPRIILGRFADSYPRFGDRISPFDDLIQQAAEDLGWDWRILASLIYQESRFDPSARSWAGARGLMQIMPGTARELGVRDLEDPASNIQAGVQHLRRLDEYWRERIQVPEERMKFVMASYNVGLGHVVDAQRLAEKNGAEPLKWKGNVERFLLLKSEPPFYSDDVVVNGYCRGEEPVAYVRDILDRFHHYQKLEEGMPNSAGP